VLFDSVSFVYQSQERFVFSDLSLVFDAGWTGLVGPNGAGKTTLLKLACGGLRPTAGRVLRSGEALYCPQRTDEPPERFDRLVHASDGEARRLRGLLGIADDWLERWGTLSHGERKRAQIATALWRTPALLAIDEPTNHIDADARRLLSTSLATFSGAGILVSHDRELLDELCSSCVVLDPPDVTVRPGGYTEALELAGADYDRARREYRNARRDLRRLEATAAERARKAANAYRMRSKRGLAPRDHDARSRKNLARYTGKDGQAGRVLRQLDGRLAQARARLDSIRIKRRQPVAIDMRGEPAKRDTVVRIPPTALRLGESRSLEFPELVMTPEDRVALVGPNGAGKSTLVRHIARTLALEGERVVHVPQEIDSEASARIIEDVRGLRGGDLGRVMSYVACLGSLPERLLQTEIPSPGETRKLLLALGLLRRPHLVIMDEPTNHLDLPSIEALENALDKCEGAMLLVSHDLRLLRRLTRTTWRIAVESEENSRLTVRHGAPEA
jgi:ATPase subunit of ABC transporter with duplicated ATPase domains